jgi:UDP-N-acetylmuramyl pentapeptide synthase
MSTLLTDSRRISNAAEGLFFALSARRNGHEFIAEAYAAGVRNFVVKHGPEFKIMPEPIFCWLMIHWLLCRRLPLPITVPV